MGTRTYIQRRAGAGLVAAAFALVAGTASMGVALGASGGSDERGGVDAPRPPQAADATCVNACVGLRKATVGATVAVVGKRLDHVAAVRFKTADGRVGVAPESVESKRVTAVVPDGAAKGKVLVKDDFGSRATTKRSLVIKPASAIQDPGAFNVQDVSVAPQRAFFGGEEQPTISYLFEAETTIDMRVDVIRRSTGEVVRSIVQADRQPFTTHTAPWDGRKDTGKQAPSGEYTLHVGPLGAGSETLGDGANFGYYSHMFPLRGRHSYGDGLGAGRGHQGQDVFAKCGTPVVAARGGRIDVRAYHGRAGYYVVIDGKQIGYDYAYMHLKKKGRPKKGTVVGTGERIGFNGATGNASGCHLHFELWSAPGWFEGGKVLNPTPKLRQWDKWS